MKRSSLACTAVALSSGLVVSAAFSLVFWAMPLADDFCRADIRSSWRQYVAYMYRTWTGRWAAMGLYSGLLPKIDITSPAYSAWLACIWIGLLLSFFVVVRLVWGRDLPLRTSAICALVLVALFLSGMPSPGETMYWLTGATEYILPMALSILAIASLARAGAYPRRRLRAVGWNALGLGLVAAVTGLHEVAGVTLFLVLLAIALTAWVERVNSAATWKTAVFVAAAGCLVAALAPGNAIRLQRDFAGGTTTARQSLHVLRLHFQAYLLPWLTSGRLALASLLVLGSGRLSSPPAWARRGGKVLLAVVPSTAAVSTLTIVLLMAVKAGTLGPLRLYDYAYGVFLVGWLVSLVVWSSRLRLPATIGDTGALNAVVAVLFGLSLLSAPAVLDYAASLTGTTTAMRYHRETARAYQLLREASRAGTRRVDLPALPSSPYSFSAESMEIGPDPSNWRNQCVARFFGLDSVYVDSTHATRIRIPTPEKTLDSRS